MHRALTIDNVVINDDSDCYVIAEIGHNHQGSVEKCKELIKAAKDAGAHAAKLQKRDNRTLYTKEMFDKPYDNENSFGATYGEHREALELKKEQYQELQRFSKSIGIAFFATAFDIPSANFLGEVDVPAFKLASGDLKSIPLLKHVAAFGKPMLLSTGGATLDDVKRAHDAIAVINANVCLMQCTAGYPPAWNELNLNVITTYRKTFPDAVIGFSSHDSGISMGPVAYVLGARIIEKHFTLNRAAKGTDHAFSLEPVGMRKLVRDLKRTREALGNFNKVPLPSETSPVTKMSKKLVAARPLNAGHVLAVEDIAMKSPGDGLPPNHIDALVGRRLLVDLRTDQNLAFELVDGAPGRASSTR